MPGPSRAEDFSERVVVLFGSEILAATVGIINGILLARLLGPAGKGDYYLLIFVPTTAVVLVQLGLPSAFAYFTARGQTTGVLARAFVLTAVLSAFALAILALLLPLLRDAFLRGFELGQVLVAFVALPLVLNATFTTAIIAGRKAVRWYAAIKVLNPVATMVLIVVILGGLGASVNAAIAVFLIAALIQMVGLAVGARQVTARPGGAGSASYRDLFRWGLSRYPGSLSEFFGLRIDMYLIAFLIADPSESVGYYTMAIALAEMVFYFPRAVDTLFFPHVAGSPREQSDRQVAQVFRVTLLSTVMFAVALAPAVAILIAFLLPAFGPSWPAFLVLLPGIVGLGASNVPAGYIAGIGRPGLTSSVSLISLATNVVANLLLIPRFGIMGAAMASLISYSLRSALLTIIAARISHTSLLLFVVPRLGDVRFAIAAGLGVVRRLRAGSRDIAA